MFLVWVIADFIGVILHVETTRPLHRGERGGFQPLERGDDKFLRIFRPAHLIVRGNGWHVERLDLGVGRELDFLIPPDGEFVIGV